MERNQEEDGKSMQKLIGYESLDTEELQATATDFLYESDCERKG